MFARLGRAVVRLRFAVIVAWVGLAAAAALFAPSLSSVGSADETSFLPAGAESVQAQDLLATAFPDESAPGSATLVFSRTPKLTAADHAYVGQVAAWASGPGAPEAMRRVVTGVVTAEGDPQLASLLTSTDGSTELAQVNLSVAGFEADANAAVDALRTHLAASAPAGLAAHVTGPAGIGRDYLSAVLAGTDRTTIVTVVLVIAVLLLIYRAPLAAMVPLCTIGAAYLVSRGLLGYLGQAGWKISTLLDAFAVVLVFGVGTDYTIFLISRFREELGRASWPAATEQTVRRIGAVITASAATVVVGLGAMSTGQFVMIQTTGPALALAIVVTLLAGLTLAPALLATFGHYLFWPRHETLGEQRAEGGFWAALARHITQRPGIVALVVLAVMAVPLFSLLQLRSSFDILAELPATSDARQGFDVVSAHFDKGQMLPVDVLVQAPAGTDLATPVGLARLHRTTAALAATPGVQSVRSLVAPGADGTTPASLRPSSQLASMAKGFASPADGDLATLLGPDMTASIQAASDYLAALGPAFPGPAGDASLTGATDDLAAFGAQLDQVRAAARAGLPASPQSQALQRQIATTAARIGTELDSLAGAFRSRPDDYFLPLGLPGSAGQAAAQAASAYLSSPRDVARLYVITADDPYATAAFQTVHAVRDAMGTEVAAYGSGTRTYVGGVTAEFADVQTMMNEDFQRVGAITVAGVFVVLALLLRSLVAPLYLVLTVLLSYGASVGLAGVLFQDVLGQPGMNYFIPLMVFVLLVALGSDYNIFLMSRVREESASREMRAGIRFASARTGAVITSAGIILAGTFAALTTAPLQVLFQAGATVALGVLVDTFVVRSLLVPAITARLGELSWWPSRGVGAPPAPGAGGVLLSPSASPPAPPAGGVPPSLGASPPEERGVPTQQGGPAR